MKTRQIIVTGNCILMKAYFMNIIFDILYSQNPTRWTFNTNALHYVIKVVHFLINFIVHGKANQGSFSY